MQFAFCSHNSNALSYLFHRGKQYLFQHVFHIFFCSVNLLHSSRCHLMLARCLLSKIHYRNGHYTHFYFTHDISIWNISSSLMQETFATEENIFIELITILECYYYYIDTYWIIHKNLLYAIAGNPITKLSYILYLCDSKSVHATSVYFLYFKMLIIDTDFSQFCRDDAHQHQYQPIENWFFVYPTNLCAIIPA